LCQNLVSSTVVGTILLQSTSANTQSFSFRCDQLSGTFYTFTIYSEFGMTTTASSGNASGGTIGSCSGGILGTGMMSLVKFTNNSGTRITYCGGFQEQYSWSQTNNGYIAEIITSQGTNVSFINCSFGSTSENENYCPPVAGTYSGSYMNFTLQSLISSQYLYMKLLLVE
jgi:hypothetical protein